MGLCASGVRTDRSSRPSVRFALGRPVILLDLYHFGVHKHLSPPLVPNHLLSQTHYSQ